MGGVGGTVWERWARRWPPPRGDTGTRDILGTGPVPALCDTAAILLLGQSLLLKDRLCRGLSRGQCFEAWHKAISLNFTSEK